MQPQPPRINLAIELLQPSNRRNDPVLKHKDRLNNPRQPTSPPKWPILAFTAPMYSGPSSVLQPRNASPMALTSVTSPITVQVPCASKNRVGPISTFACSYVRAISPTWDCRLGCVIHGVRPSWFEPVSRITAQIVSPSRRASVSRFSIAIPSPRAYPFARSSKLQQRLSGEKKLNADMTFMKFGWNTRFAPPTIA
ncbi:hypothetical protein BDW62DRAFT_127229 [Aspergillus aurantiobrunneus]